MKALCARSLTGYKRPTAFFVVEAMPKNAVGKIDKASLRAGHAALSTGPATGDVPAGVTVTT
ncbi:hypothetical protein ACF05L_20600 [Streptomyces bobili]|uniref:hypothetical protein n=1 Tax=Streptomyces bobili TaxID=67280 RepID=UPI0036F69EAA